MPNHRREKPRDAGNGFEEKDAVEPLVFGEDVATFAELFEREGAVGWNGFVVVSGHDVETLAERTDEPGCGAVERVLRLVAQDLDGFEFAWSVDGVEEHPVSTVATMRCRKLGLIVYKIINISIGAESYVVKTV